jgi:hypothetical protein
MQVRSFENLVQWLQEKHPDIKKEVLDFEGKNQVLWWAP